VSADLAAYLLLAMNLLVVAVVLSLPILLLWALLGRPRPVPGAPPLPRRSSESATRERPRHAAGGGSTVLPGSEIDEYEVTAAPGERVLRRCDDCGVLWKGLPGKDSSVPVLKLRRWMRRRTRARKTDTPGWAKRQGWSRCPSCLSTKVRTSRAQRSRR
jgi:hypothetical protein